MEILELSKSELNGKSVIEYLNMKYDSVEKVRGNTYELNDEWVEVLTEEDIRMNEIIRKSFYRCLYGGKLKLDYSSILDKINEYLESNKDIDKEKYFENTRGSDYNMVDDVIYNYIAKNRYELMEMIF
jgi:hypothetical protein